MDSSTPNVNHSRDSQAKDSSVENDGEALLVTEVASAPLPTDHGVFQCRAFADVSTGEQHVAMVMGEFGPDDVPLVRVHSECLTGDLMGSLRCDCGLQLQAALAAIAKNGNGVLVYLRGHEGRGIGLAQKLHAYNLQDQGHDTVDANLELGLPVDSREYGVGASILTQLGVHRMKLMTNNPSKTSGLEGFGLEIVERVALESTPNPNNIGYLRTKRDRMGHMFADLEDGATD